MRHFLALSLLTLTWSGVTAQITLDPGAFPQITLEATERPGELMRPQFSTDLAAWQTLAPVPVDADGRLRFIDFAGGNQQRRFYRAISTTPAGSWLIYERRAQDGTSIIYRSRLDGTQEAGIVVGRYPRVSPDGRWILLTRNGTGPSLHFGADIYLYDTTVIPSANNPRLLYDNGSYDIISYCFKHDNFRFVFDFGFDGRLYTMTRDGGVPQLFFPTGDCQEAMPSFSPDDSSLAFAHRIPSQVATRQVGGVKRPLTPAGLGDSWPQWSPDGTWVAACDGNTDFSRTDLGHDLLRIDPVTGTRTQLTHVPDPGDGFPFGGVVSANNLWIYAAGTVSGVQGVWRIPSSGGAPQAVNITSALTSPIVFIGGIVP